MSEKWVIVEREKLRGLSRAVAKIEALLLALVVLSLWFVGVDADDRLAISAALLFYAAFVFGIHYFEFRKAESNWTIAARTWVMIPFITLAIWFTDKTSSPLLNVYLVIIVTSALTLGMRATLYQLGLVCICYVLLGETLPSDIVSTIAYVGGLLTQITPLILVAYVTSVFSADIRFWMSRTKLPSEIDTLTGLYTVRGFAIIADRLFARAVRGDHAPSLLVIDVDHFKSVTGVHGNKAWNDLLQRLAKSIQAGLRHNDVLARYGEDEFVVLLPETPSGRALHVAERIREAMAATPVEIDGKPLTASVCIGLTTYTADDESISSILARADRALSLAKEQGFNKVAALTV
ncbi:MAG: GGDEF domain-containing protein [Pyrinomonadaceae bacterium]